MYRDDDFSYEEPVKKHIPLCTNVALGLTLGQNRNPPALAVVEAEWRQPDPGVDDWVKHFKVRHLEQLAVKSSYPAIAERLQEVSKGLKERDPRWGLSTYVDITGLGQPVFELLEDRVSGLRLKPVTFNHGDQRSEVEGELRLGKAYLVTRLQTLLQTDRLHLGRSKHGNRLARELLDYQLDTTDNANDTYGAFQVGTRDQLVTCLGLALNKDIWCEIPRPPVKRKRQVGRPWRYPTLREIYERMGTDRSYFSRSW